MILGDYKTERLKLLLSHTKYAEQVTDYLKRNKDFLRDFEPVRDVEYYTLEYQRSQLEKDMAAAESLSGVRFWLVKKECPDRFIGMSALSQIVMGAFKSCFLSYRLSYDQTNAGYMTEALEKCIDVAFNVLGLHRLEANIMPGNKPSLRVAEKLGFENEGVSKKYLRINNVWEDHIHMVLINDNLKD